VERGRHAMVINEKAKKALEKFYHKICGLIDEFDLGEPDENGYYPINERAHVNKKGKSSWDARNVQYTRAADMEHSKYPKNALFALHNVYKKIYELVLMYESSRSLIGFGLGLITEGEQFNRLRMEFAYIAQEATLEPERGRMVWVVDEKTQRMAEIYLEYFDDLSATDNPLDFIPSYLFNIMMPLAGIDTGIFENFNMDVILATFKVVPIKDQIEHYHFVQNVLKPLSKKLEVGVTHALPKKHDDAMSQPFLIDFKRWHILHKYEKEISGTYHLDEQSNDIKYRLMNLLLSEKNWHFVQSGKLSALEEKIKHDDETNTPVCSINGVTIKIKDYLLSFSRICAGHSIKVSEKNKEELGNVSLMLHEQIKNNAPGLVGQINLLEKPEEKIQLAEKSLAKKSKKVDLTKTEKKEIDRTQIESKLLKWRLSDKKKQLEKQKKKKTKFSKRKKRTKKALINETNTDILDNQTKIVEVQIKIHNYLDRSQRLKIAQQQVAKFDAYLIARHNKHWFLDFVQQLLSLFKTPDRVIQVTWLKNLCDELIKYVNGGRTDQIEKKYDEGIRLFGKSKHSREKGLPKILIDSKEQVIEQDYGC